jgi:PAS domain S-box-containing protein
VNNGRARFLGDGATNGSASFRALIQNIKDYAIFTVDPQGIVTDWTEGARQVLGYSLSEVIGRDFRMFFTDEDVDAGEPQMELDQAAAEGRAERESWRVHRNGGRIWVNAISSAIRDESGGLVGFIKVSRDLTERRRIEMERAQDARELRQARQLADKANQAKSRFLATASHDLRQPLQSLSLLSGTLRRMATNPYLLDAVEQQELAIASMSGLLNALLDISKLDSGSIQPSLQHLDLDDLFAQMRIEFGGLAAKKALALNIPGCAHFVSTDPTLLGQILRNLLSNAIRYTQQGSVTLYSTLQDGHVNITVRDTGIGIAETHLERIFEEFYQVDVSPNSVREGHGLGLSIVQRTAAILGHALRVDSRQGSGSSFTIAVPACPSVPELSANHQLAAAAVCGKAPHVLLIEDDPGVQKATRLLLEVEGYRVTVGRTPADARAAAADHPDIQLLICDYHLADGESGREAIEIVREALPRIEVILMTGDTSSGLRQVSPADRICVASKPMEADALLGMMKHLLMQQAATDYP